MKGAVFNTGSAFNATVLIDYGAFIVHHGKHLMRANFDTSPAAGALAWVQF